MMLVCAVPAIVFLAICGVTESQQDGISGLPENNDGLNYFSLKKLFNFLREEIEVVKEIKIKHNQLEEQLLSKTRDINDIKDKYLEIANSVKQCEDDLENLVVVQMRSQKMIMEALRKEIEDMKIVQQERLREEIEHIKIVLQETLRKEIEHMKTVQQEDSKRIEWLTTQLENGFTTTNRNSSSSNCSVKVVAAPGKTPKVELVLASPGECSNTNHQA